MLALTGLDPTTRSKVESELAVRVRAEDGAFGSMSLGELITSDLAVGKASGQSSAEESVFGVLLRWRGLEDLQFLPVSEPVWRALPLDELPLSNQRVLG